MGILPSRRTPLPGQGYPSLKKNAHARAGVFFFSRRRNTPAGAGIYLPPGGYPCPGMEIHARAPIVLDCSSLVVYKNVTLHVCAADYMVVTTKDIY